MPSEWVVDPEYTLLGRKSAGIIVGLGVASASTAIALGVIARTVKSPTVFLVTPPPTRLLTTLIVWTTVLFVLRLLPAARRSNWGGWATIASVLAVFIVLAEGIRGVRRLLDDLAWPRLVDSMGIAGVSVAALVAGCGALFFAIAATFDRKPIQRRALVGSFLVAALAISLISYGFVDNYRSGVWHPRLTAPAASVLPLPDTVGTERYRVQPAKLGGSHSITIDSAGTGFIAYNAGGVTAYDGPTGRIRWRADNFGSPPPVGWGHHPAVQDVVVARREAADQAGIVVLLLYGAVVVALDGNTGNMLWGRQYRGNVTLTAGWADALAITTSNDTVSLDPVTGQVRWSKSGCGSPKVEPGITGQFLYMCGYNEAQSIVDSRTGNAIPMPGVRGAVAYADAYVIDNRTTTAAAPTAANRVTVIDTTGHIIDETTGASAVSGAHDGYLLLYGVGDVYLWRNFRTHQSTPVRIDELHGSFFGLEKTWLRHRFVVTEAPGPLLLLDPTHPDAAPVSIPRPCEHVTGLDAVAGAVAVSCGWQDMEVVGMAAYPAREQT